MLSISDDDLGRTTIIQHQIDVGTAVPVRQPPRRLPFHQRELVQQHVDKMLKNGIIEPSTGPWSSPIVMVKKRDGSMRFCIDFRKVNDLTKKDAHPLPRIDDTLDTLGEAQWFSTLDLASGYWQVEMDPADREKTAFATPDGLYQFRVMPFGLCNAPGTFQRLMERVLRGLHWRTCLVYLDDIIIFSKTIQDHLLRLAEVFTRLRNAGLKLKPSKCHLLRKSVHYLGHVVSNRGVETDPAKIKCIAEWPTPSNAKELRQFLGLASYYRRFVRGFATIASPLHRLSEKNKAWTWTDECDQAFNSLKHRLGSAPVLRLPNFSHDFILDVDASGHGLGAVLSQDIGGHEQVVAYASRALTKAEKRYCATRRELLALIWGARHFRPYLFGRPFIARTDHNSLKWLRNFREPEGQVARWLEILAEYDFKVVHRPGPQHTNADALSRVPCRQCDYRADFEEEDGDVPEVSTISPSSWFPSRDVEELKSSQNADSALRQMITWLSKKSMPSHLPRGSSTQLQSLWTQRHYLVLQDGILYRRWEDIPGKGLNKKFQLVLPQHLVAETLTQLHNSATAGHLGVKKTLEKVRSRFYWVGQRRDVDEWCKACLLCAARKSEPRRRKAPLQMGQATAPLQRVAMDILGPLSVTERGNKYILVIGDYFTKWKEAYPMKNMEAVTVANILVQEFISRFGIPKHLHTDQGRNFESGLMKEICSLLDIKKTRTTPYHPQSDGMIERFNRTLLDMLSTAVKNDHRNWDVQLPLLMLAYRTSVQETTGATPFSLMFGRPAQLPIDLEFNLPTATYGNSPNSYQHQLREHLQQAYQTVRKHTLREQSRHKHLYDRRAHGTPYSIGDEVWLHCPAVPRGLCRKFHRPWQGPFIIVTVISDTVYRIQNKSTRKRVVVHYNRLKPYFPPFNKEIFGSGHSPTQVDPGPGSTEQSPQSDGNAISDSTPDISPADTVQSRRSDGNSDCDSAPDVSPVEPAVEQRIPAVDVTISPESYPPLRRSSRRRQPPDRFGSSVTFPDCYSSDSDS